MKALKEEAKKHLPTPPQPPARESKKRKEEEPKKKKSKKSKKSKKEKGTGALALDKHKESMKKYKKVFHSFLHSLLG